MPVAVSRRLAQESTLHEGNIFKAVLGRATIACRGAREESILRFRELCLVALAFVLTLSRPAPVRAGAETALSAGQQITEFVTAREALLARPDGSLEEYRRLAQ